MNPEGDTDDHSTKAKHHEFKGFGYFLVEAAEEIDQDLAIKLATSLDFSPAEIGKLECCTDNSLFFMRRLRQKGLIEPDNIKTLVDCLRRHGEEGTAKEIEKCFRTIGRGTTEICSGESDIDVKDKLDDPTPLEHGSLETSQEQSSSDGTRKRKQEISGETRKMRHIQEFVPGEDCMIYVLMKTPILHDESQMNEEVKVSQRENEDGNKENTEDEAKFKGISGKHPHRGNTERTGTCTVEEQDQEEGGKRESEEDQMKGEDDIDNKSGKDIEDKNMEDKECNDDDGDKSGDDGDGDDDNDDDTDSCSEDEDTNESTYLVVKNNLKPMLLHIRKRTETELEINQAFKIKSYSQCENMIVIEESSVLRKSCDDRFFRDRVTPQLVEKARNMYLQMKSAYREPAFDVHGVKHVPVSQIIPSLKAIVTNISFHVDQFNNKKTHITLKDKEFGASLRVLINDAHVKSSGLMEGSIVTLKNFKTYRSPNYTTNCLVSTKDSRIIKNAKSETLQDVRDLLPLVGCYQVEGKLKEIEKSFKKYPACPGSQCFATAVRKLPSGKYKCPKCCQTFKHKECAQGIYLDVSISEEHEESKQREHHAIIFKNSLIKILKDYRFPPQDQSQSSIWKSFDENFYGKEVLVVIKPPIKGVNSIITSMKLL